MNDTAPLPGREAAQLGADDLQRSFAQRGVWPQVFHRGQQPFKREPMGGGFCAGSQDQPVFFRSRKRLHAKRFWGSLGSESFGFFEGSHAGFCGDFGTRSGVLCFPKYAANVLFQYKIVI